MSCSGAGQEEDNQQNEGQVPRMHGMGDGREEGGEDAPGRQRLFGVGPVDERRNGRTGDDGPHGGGGDGAGTGDRLTERGGGAIGSGPGGDGVGGVWLAGWPGSGGE